MIICYFCHSLYVLCIIFCTFSVYGMNADGYFMVLGMKDLSESVTNGINLRTFGIVWYDLRLKLCMMSDTGGTR